MPAPRRLRASSRTAPRVRSRSRRCLPLALAAIVVGSCGTPPPGPTATASPTAGATAPTSTPADAAIAGLSRIVMRSPGSAGATWWVTEAGRPGVRVPLAVPFDDADLGPAGADGQILLTTTDQIVVARVEAATLTPTTSVPMPAGQRLEPACFGGDGRALLADAETLELVELDGNAVRLSTDVGSTLGECTPLADGGTLVAVDGGGLIAVRDGAPPIPVVALRGRHLSGGGGRVAMTDPSDERGEAVVRHATVSEAGILGAAIGRVVGRGSERVVDVHLSPDGGWLAVIVEDGTDAEAIARLRLYRVTEAGLSEVTDLEIDVGTRIAVLPGDRAGPGSVRP